MDFKLHAPYKPTGDQPEAIRQLLDGMARGYNDQVLLGATGTGKSLGWDEPVYLVHAVDHTQTPRLEPIGAVLDAAFAAAAHVRTVGDSQVYDLPLSSERLLAQAIDPATLAVGLYPIQSFSRHPAPAEMFRLTTTCGRSAVLTGDHNLWVVRAGELRLIATQEARRGDLIPAPTALLGVPASAAETASDPAAAELAHLQGVYLATAAWEGDCLTFALPDASRAARLGEVCTALGLDYSQPTSTALTLSDPAVAARLAGTLGRDPADRHLPSDWPQFAPETLVALLTAFFDLSLQFGTSAEIFVRTGDRLAADLLYALLRLGLWATALAAPTLGETYVRLQGRAELHRFQALFSLTRDEQRTAWATLFKARRRPAPPPPGERVPLASIELARLQLEIAGGAVRPVPAVSPSLTARPRLRAALDTLAGQRLRLGPAASRLPADWDARWEQLDRLANLHWLEVQGVEPVDYPHPYVYDLTVPGVETFLAGHGGMFVHNTFTMASIIEQMRLPTLVMAHNKTLAAQLYAEFKEFFPENAVEYFVSYYDYYQPEAYVPRQDLYIEKDSDINEEIERLRLAATTALMSRRDTIVVASVSCIYGIGNPEAYGRMVVNLESGNVYRRNALLRQLVEGQYERNDLELRPGTFRVRGDSLDILPAYSERVGMRITFFGDEVERILEFDTVTGELKRELKTGVIYPAKHFITDSDKLRQAIADIEAEAAERVAELRAADKLLEAQRLEQRTTYDLEMLREVGYCSGIENYSRHLDQRPPGSPPWTLMDYLPSDYLLVIDESHMTIPQVRGMFNGDQARKATLVEYGFRLPSAMDNRPLTFAEFEERMGRTIYTSATPGPYERAHADQIVEQIIRPTGLVDPEVEIRPIEGQVDDLVGEIRQRTANGERVLVTTLTKRMAEKLADYLLELGIKVHYLHSEVDTLERIGILRDLRLGVFDVVVGINLLREGLDLPEVSLVAILDADKEGFLRSDTALIQTIGRAARHVHGRVIMYADVITASMQRALDATNHRRTVQQAYNREHGIEPVSIFKAVRDLTDQLTLKPGAEPTLRGGRGTLAGLPKNELQHLIQELEKQMKTAARDLEFEKAAALRDQVFELRAILADETNAPPWERARLLAERDDPEG